MSADRQIAREWIHNKCPECGKPKASADDWLRCDPGCECKLCQYVCWEEVGHCGEGHIHAHLAGQAYGAQQERTRLFDSMPERFRDWRCLREGATCSRCDGAGRRMYGSTATWRGGIGGQAITADVCDKCWGSGDEKNPWPSWRDRE